MKELDSLIISTGPIVLTCKCRWGWHPRPFALLSLQRMPCEHRRWAMPSVGTGLPGVRCSPCPLVSQTRQAIQVQWEPWVAVHRLLWEMQQVMGSDLGIQERPTWRRNFDRNLSEWDICVQMKEGHMLNLTSGKQVKLLYKCTELQLPDSVFWAEYSEEVIKCKDWDIHPTATFKLVK